VPKVSIVIPVYNTGSYLPECLESVMAQTLTDIEIICVNDGSTDDSLDVLNDFAARDARFIVLNQPNRGLCGARNAGLDRATGEYLLFLDSDDFFAPTMLEDAYSASVEDDADICIFKIRYYNEQTRETIDADWSLRTEMLPDKRPFGPEDMVGRIFRFVTPCVWNKMLRRSFVVENGVRFSAELSRAEDVAFTYLALILARRITTIDKALVYYRTGLPGSMQATIHEKPFEICRALELLKSHATEAGVFDFYERDFVNEALYQCLFTLETIKTAAAFGELYAGLKDRYFGVLGIDGRDPEYFYESTQYDGYTRVSTLSKETFLFDEVRSLKKRVGEAGDQLYATREMTRSAIRAVKKLKGSRAYRLGRRATAIPRGVARLVTGRGKAR